MNICVLINDRGALSKQIKRLRNFSLYNPVKYHAEIDGANAKAIISPLEGSIGEFSSFDARLYIALYPDAFIEALRGKFADGKKRPQNLGRLNKIFRFVDGPFHTVGEKKNCLGSDAQQTFRRKAFGYSFPLRSRRNSDKIGI